MNVLLIYRSGIAYNEFNETYDKYKGNKVYAIVENKIIKNCMKYLYKDITFYFLSDLLKDKINMKFDYIVGNPPYQYPKITQRKLYIDVTSKVIKLLKKYGEISFITPVNILIPNTKKKDIDDFLNKYLTSVNYDANNDFNIGQDVIQWKASVNKNTNFITVIENKKEKKVTKINECIRSGYIIFFNIMSKVSIKYNNLKKTKNISNQ